MYIYTVYMTIQTLTDFGSTMTILSVLALLLVAVTMGLSLAHALEFPGKLRLDEPTYRLFRRSTIPASQSAASWVNLGDCWRLSF